VPKDLCSGMSGETRMKSVDVFSCGVDNTRNTDKYRSRPMTVVLPMNMDALGREFVVVVVNHNHNKVKVYFYSSALQAPFLFCGQKDLP
jgi:mRNA-degrading endonuclease toxin of MazEF toxin-antitoxin module